MKERVAFSILFFLLGCSSKPVPILTVTLSDQNKSITIKGLDYAAIDELRTDSAGSLWQRLIPVYRMPADTEMKDYQHAQPGKYRISATDVIFLPDTPFVKNQAYFIRRYHYEEGTNIFDMVKKRRKLGDIPYTDFIFKY